MDSVRAFIALELDSSVKEKISSLISQLKNIDSSIKWVPSEALHFTLKFLGNIDTAMIQPIANELEKISKDTPCFKISFSKIGAFPNMNRPKVIWIGVENGAQSIIHLAQKCESHLETLGFKKEPREYKAHLTLGRVKSLKNIDTVIKKAGEIDLPIDSAGIQKITLFQSDLTSKGAIYKELNSFKFNI